MFLLGACERHACNERRAPSALDGTCDRELSGPHEWEEVEYVLFRHPRASEVEQYFEDCSPWALDVFVHFILDIHVSTWSSRYSSRWSDLALGTAKFFEFLFSIGSSVKCRRSSKNAFRGTAVKSRALRKSPWRVTVRLVTYLGTGCSKNKIRVGISHAITREESHQEIEMSFSILRRHSQASRATREYRFLGRDSNIPWCISNIKPLVSASVVQCGTTQVLDGVVEAKLDMSNVLVPVLGSNTSIFLQKCIVILCFWFLTKYVLWQDVVCGDHVNTDARRGQLIRRKDRTTEGSGQSVLSV